MPRADPHHQLYYTSSHHETAYSLSSQECQEQINTISFILASAGDHENLLPVKPRIPGADQPHQLHSSFSHHETTYFLSSQECQEQMNTISFIPTPATVRELTNCQAKNARSRSTPSTSLQLQPPSENLLPVKPRMAGADEYHQLYSSSSHHKRTYKLSSQEWQEQINTISFIPAPVTMRELTCCQAKNGRSRSTPSTSFQLQPP
jgi:hypothetical protein